MDPVIQKAFEASKNERSYAFATVINATLKGTPRKAGAKMIVLEDGTLYGTIGGGRNEKAAKKECIKALKSGKPHTVTYDYFGQEGQSVCGGQIKVFIEPFINKHHFVICGGGHIALPLSLYAKSLNFKVTIIDNRKEYANKKRFRHVDQIIVKDYCEAFHNLKITPNTAIMIVTHGNEHDFECLKEVISSKAKYIGVISSQSKKIKFFNRLKKLGIKISRLKKISIPAGFDIGAQTPEEIAISIISEMIAVKNKQFIGTIKFKEKG